MAYDKKLHFAAGLIISALVGYILHHPGYGLAASVFAGVMKEVRDWCCYRGFDWRDMVATWLGGLVGFIAVLLIGGLL